MIVTREIYDAIAKGQPWVVCRMSRLTHVDAPTEIRNLYHDEIQERETFTARRSTCPYPEGRTANLRYREYPKGWEKGDPLPPAQGKGIKIIVTETDRQDDGKWLIRWERVGPHRPIPVSGANYFLAPARGYTTSAEASIDKEAPAIPSEEIDAMVADDLAAKREQQRKHAEHLQQTVAAIKDGEHDTKIRRTLGDIDSAAAELRELLDADAA